MFDLGKVPINEPSDLLKKFSFCVDGELNESTLGFLRSVARANPVGLEKLTTKLQQHIQIQVPAEALHAIIHGLTEQLKIPRNALQVVHTFLQEEHTQALFRELQTLAHTQSKLQNSVLHMMDNLNILTNATQEGQFLRLIITLMLEWTSGPEHARHDASKWLKSVLSTSDQTDIADMISLMLFPGTALVEQFFLHLLYIMLEWTTYAQRTTKNAAKWLKSVLNIPYKSEMAQIIQLIADQLHLGDYIMPGQTRNMDCLELFMHLENLTVGTQIVLVDETNKQFMVDMHATLLTVMICKHSPNALYDVVALHEQHPDYAVLPAMQAYQTDPLHLEKFFQTSMFKEYFPQQREQHGRVNQHIFISSLISYIHTATQTDTVTQNLDLAKIAFFIHQCAAQLRAMDNKNFMQWYQTHPQIAHMEALLPALLFKALYMLALNQKQYHSGRIRASALQLVTLGFSHRSASALATGTFQPLVKTDIAAIDTDNIAGMITFFKQQSAETRRQLAQEILLLSIVSQSSTTHHHHRTFMVESPALEKLNAPKLKSIVPQLSRANPLDRNRLFSSKSSATKTNAGNGHTHKPTFRT